MPSPTSPRTGGDHRGKSRHHHGAADDHQRAAAGAVHQPEGYDGGKEVEHAEPERRRQRRHAGLEAELLEDPRGVVEDPVDPAQVLQDEQHAAQHQHRDRAAAPDGGPQLLPRPVVGGRHHLGQAGAEPQPAGGNPRILKAVPSEQPARALRQQVNDQHPAERRDDAQAEDQRPGLLARQQQRRRIGEQDPGRHGELERRHHRAAPAGGCYLSAIHRCNH